MKNTKDWERDIYAKGKQLNAWPNTELVSEIKKEFSNDELRNKIVLEIGCGTGNNLLFFGSEGCKLKGLEYSETALVHAQSNLKKFGLEAELKHGSVTTSLPWDSDSIDIVVDRGCLTQVKYPDIPSVIDEIYRVLKNNGRFFSFTLLGDESDDLKYGLEIYEKTFDQFTEGYFTKNGLTSVYNSSTIKNMLKKFRVLSLNKLEKTNELSGNKLVYYNSVSMKLT